MEVQFTDERLDRLETDKAYDGGYGKPIARAFRKAMQAIRNAPDERVFYQSRGLGYEKLQGQRAGQYSFRLNIQMRLIIRYEGEGSAKQVVVMAIEDYH